MAKTANRISKTTGRTFVIFIIWLSDTIVLLSLQIFDKDSCKKISFRKYQRLALNSTDLIIVSLEYDSARICNRSNARDELESNFFYDQT
jgi:hypothetical protein